ncbi:redox-regulated ATPase YchF, partial [Acinetobacter baumannii]
GDITHVENRIDPLADAETVETELMLSDMESLEKRITANETKARGGDKEAKLLVGVIEKVLPALREGKPARTVLALLTEDEVPVFKGLQ